MSGVVRLAVLGDPLAFTRSPDLHRAALAALRLTGDSRALRTSASELGARLVSLASEDVAGFNVTHPLKEPVIAHLSRVAPDAALARSVNTVGREPSGWWGDSTDGPGFVDWLTHLGRRPAVERVLIFGAGGAARSIALSLSRLGRDPVRIATRGGEDSARREAWRELEGAAVWVAPGEPLERAIHDWATVIVNATPLAGAAGPRDPARLAERTLVLDLVYSREPTAWVCAARARGFEAHDGLGLLVFQARRSLSLWLERDVPLEPLMQAVGAR